MRNSHAKQKRTEHIPLSGPTLTLLNDMRAKAEPQEANLLPGTTDASYWISWLERLAEIRRESEQETRVRAETPVLAT
jgi:hypothetical protein